MVMLSDVFLKSLVFSLHVMVVVVVVGGPVLLPPHAHYQYGGISL